MTTPYRFDTDTQVKPRADGRWAAELDPGWAGMAGVPNGGYLLATALNAASAALDGAEPLTVTGHFLRPGAVGAADIEVEVVRRGRLMSTAEIRLSQDGKERLRILAGFGDHDALAGPVGFSPEAPVIPPPEQCAAAPEAPTVAGASIAGRFDYRVTADSRWVRGAPGETAQLDAWIRFADGREPDLAALPLVVDAFPPVMYEVTDGVVFPTVELTLHLRQRPAPGWLQARVRARAHLGGLVEEDVDLWDAQGRLVAMSRQLALVVPAG
jgi:acyl-CoA thioesterase